MDTFRALEAKTVDGSVRLIHTVGVPRSMSTAFCRALNEMDSPSVYVNEPLNRENADVNKAAEHILQACSVVNPTSGITVITKNMASYTSEMAYKNLESISVGTIWHIRDPLIQIGSLLTRIVNDLHTGPGENKITQDNIYPYLNDACDYLVDSSKSSGFSKTGWVSLEKHFLAKNQSSHCIVDGGYFTEQPADVLTLVCNELGVVFSKNMIDGWKNGFVNVINIDCQHETTRSAWTGTAANSTGVMPATREMLDMNKIPESLAEHIENVAIPVYRRIISENRV